MNLRMTEDGRKKPGPAPTMPERIVLPMPEGMTAEIDAVRGENTRVGFIRAAIADKLKQRTETGADH